MGPSKGPGQEVWNIMAVRSLEEGKVLSALLVGRKLRPGEEKPPSNPSQNGGLVGNPRGPGTGISKSDSNP